MAELNEKVIRSIVQEVVTDIVTVKVNGLRQEMQEGFAAAEKNTMDVINLVRDELRGGIAAAEKNTMTGINQVLETIQSLTDEDRDEMTGITGRLRNHNERIAKLERLSNLR